MSDDTVSYMVATRGSGRLVIPLAFRASLEDAEGELELRQAVYPSARVFELREVGGSLAPEGVSALSQRAVDAVLAFLLGWDSDDGESWEGVRRLVGRYLRPIANAAAEVEQVSSPTGVTLAEFGGHPR